MRLRLAKLPATLASKELGKEIKIVRQLLTAALVKTGVECYVIDKPQIDQSEEIIIRFSNHGAPQ